MNKLLIIVFSFSPAIIVSSKGAFLSYFCAFKQHFQQAGSRGHLTRHFTSVPSFLQKGDKYPPYSCNIGTHVILCCIVFASLCPFHSSKIVPSYEE